MPKQFALADKGTAKSNFGEAPSWRIHPQVAVPERWVHRARRTIRPQVSMGNGMSLEKPNLNMAVTFTVIVGEGVEPDTAAVTYRAAIERHADAIFLVHRTADCRKSRRYRRSPGDLVAVNGNLESSNHDGELFILSRNRPMLLPPTIGHQPADGFIHADRKDGRLNLFGFVRLHASDVFSRRCLLMPGYRQSGGLVCRIAAVENRRNGAS